MLHNTLYGLFIATAVEALELNIAAWGNLLKLRTRPLQYQFNFIIRLCVDYYLQVELTVIIFLNVS